MKEGAEMQTRSCADRGKVWYRHVRGGKGRKNKLEPDEREGMWLGHARTSDAVLIGTTAGVVRAYSIARQPGEDRWDADFVKEMTGTPQRPDLKKPGMQIPVSITFGEGEEEDGEKTRTREEEIRRMRITQAHLDEYGYTDGCDGCRFKRAGLAGGRAHSERCRKRIMEELEKTEAGRRAEQREDQRIGIRMETIMEENQHGENDNGDVDMEDGTLAENVSHTAATVTIPQDSARHCCQSTNHKKAAKSPPKQQGTMDFTRGGYRLGYIVWIRAIFIPNWVPCQKIVLAA